MVGGLLRCGLYICIDRLAIVDGNYLSHEILSVADRYLCNFKLVNALAGFLGGVLTPLPSQSFLIWSLQCAPAEAGIDLG